MIATLAILAVASFAIRCGFSVETLQFTGLVGILAWASMADLSNRVIPNACILAATGLRIVCLAALALTGRLAATEIAYYIASGLGVGAALLLFSLTFERVTGRKGMGGGDV
ncbi:MAG: prepilin peptidase, partial [Eggerthellaceae bacterium]|nr:prepilin peptidase [Eggerthellaceae bacterium]